MADANAVKEITAKLESGVMELFESEKYANYLQTMSRFHKYSTRNTLLIHLQMPDATRVAGYNAWKNKFNRQVKKGEKGIRIFAPMPFVVKEELEKLDPVTKQPIIGEDGQPVMEEYVKMQSARFKIVPVFDVSQTDGEPLPELAETLTGDVARYELFMDSLRAVSPLPVSFEDLPPDTDGTCYFGEKIAIRNGMSEIQTVSAVIHEITHAKLHDLQIVTDNGEKVKDRRTEEVEAESISFAVAQYYGIDTGANSFGYIAEWSKGRELKELNASLDTIRKTAAELIDGIDEQYRALAKERGIDLTVDAAANAQDEPASETPIATSSPELSANQIYAKYANTVADKAADYAVSSATLLKTDETEARRATDQIVRRVVDDLLLESGEFYPLFNEYMGNMDFRERLEDYAFIRAYLEPTKAAQMATPIPEPAVNPAVADIIAAYARHAEVADPQRIGAGVLMTPVFDDGNFNRSGKKIRVAVEEPAGKYKLYSQVSNDGNYNADKSLYFLTASGMIDRTAQYFRDEWNEETHKWENHRPTEAELDEIIGLVHEQFEKDMADPKMWAKYQHAAILNRIPECEAHNVPVRKLREEESKLREAEAEKQRQEEKRIKAEKYDARIDEIATAMNSGKAISVGYDEYTFDGKNPVLDLFKLYGIDLPLRTQGWVNTGLAEINDGGYRYYKSKHKGDSTAFSGYLKKLRDAIRLTPIDQKRQQENLAAIKTEVKNTLDKQLYEKFAGLFPDFAEGKYSYMRLESKGFEPLSLEWVFGDRISVMHTYELNGDLCYDPMMEFRFNNIGKTMAASMFEQSIPPLYQYFNDEGVGISVDGNGNTRTVRNLQSQLDDFADMWLNNIAEQGYMPVKAILWNEGKIDDVDVAVTFDADGNPILPEPEPGQQDIKAGDTLLIQGKKWLVEKIDGDFSISLKNLDPNDIQSDQMFMGQWKQRLAETGYSVLNSQDIEPPQKQYDLGYGFFGNGITVWNHAEQSGNDYATVAHIAPDRTVTIYDNDMPHEVRQQIDTVANSPDTQAFGFSRAPENVPPHIDGAAAPSIVYETVKRVLPETMIAHYARMPDPTVTILQMKEYGYSYEEMLPLTESWALELYDSNNTVYLLYPDGTEAMALDRDEIANHDGLFGIERGDWERSPIYAKRMADAANAEGRREADLLYGDNQYNRENKFGIYQVRDDLGEVRDFRFVPMRELEALGLPVERENYELVYTAPLSERIEFLSDRYPALNRIYQDFNVNLPSDYTARSVSVSDVIVLRHNGDISAFYVDSAGFKELEGFLGEETKRGQMRTPEAERAANDNIVDITAASPPNTTLDKQEADVKAGKAISIMDLSKAVNSGQKPVSKGKPSLLGRLDEAKKIVEQSKQTAVAANKKERGHE